MLTPPLQPHESAPRILPLGSPAPFFAIARLRRAQLFPECAAELPYCHIPAKLRHHAVVGIEPGETTVEGLDK